MACFDEIRQMIKAAYEVPSGEKSDCPSCGWSLLKHPVSNELHCPFDGWPWKEEGPGGVA